jgi:hypothetical protein
MTTVAVIGSYNRDKGKYHGATLHTVEQFREYCAGLGRIIADRGYQLLVVVSNDHLPAQLPFLFNETADYCSWYGFIQESLYEGDSRALAHVCVSDEMLARLRNPGPSADLRATSIAAVLNRSNRVKRYAIDGSPERNILRSEMLRCIVPVHGIAHPIDIQVPTADVIVLVGGGKATDALANIARENGAPLLAVPYFGGVAGDVLSKQMREGRQPWHLTNAGIPDVSTMLEETASALDALIRRRSARPRVGNFEQTTFAWARAGVIFTALALIVALIGLIMQSHGGPAVVTHATTP